MEKAFLETDDDELAVFEEFLDHESNVLRVREVQRRVDLIQNVQRRRLVPKQCQDQAQCE